MFVSSYFPITSKVVFNFRNDFNKRIFKISDKNGFSYCSKKILTAVATTITLLAIPCLLVIEVAVKTVKTFKAFFYPPLDDCHFLFKSNVFDSYVKQLQEQIRSELKKQPLLSDALEGNKVTTPLVKTTLELINTVLTGPHSNKKSAKKAFHQNFIALERAVIDLKEKLISSEDPLNKQIFQFIDELSIWQYTKNSLLDQMVVFLDKNVGTQFKQESFPQAVSKINEYFKNSRAFSGILETVGRLYDPLYLGDMPSFLYDFEVTQELSVKVIRTPSVVRDVLRDKKGDLIEVAVLKEFLNLLQVYQKQGKRHLYINLMQRHGSEGLRSEKIENLEQDATVKEGCCVVTLDKDSSFYWQNHTSENQSALSFKKAFLESMFQKSKHYYWSEKLNLNDWQDKCSQIIDEVHTTKFGNNTSLDRQQRLDFIELTHASIVVELMNIFKPTTFNMSCKSTIDRGASANSVLYLKALEMQGKKIDKNSMSEAMAIAFCPAALTQNRTVLKIRPPRLKATLTRMFGNMKV